MILIRISKGRENLSAHPEIRMFHVRAFNCLRHAQSDATEFGGCHGSGVMIE